MLYLAHPDVWKQDLDNLQTATKETRGTRNVVSEENATANLVALEESNEAVLREADKTKSLLNKICKH